MEAFGGALYTAATEVVDDELSNLARWISNACGGTHNVEGLLLGGVGSHRAIGHAHGEEARGCDVVVARGE